MIRATIIGAAGYTGAELVGLLAAHGDVEIAGLFGSEKRSSAQGEQASDAPRFSDAYPRFRGIVDLLIEPTTLDGILAQQPDAVFLATPHEVSHRLAPQLLQHGIVVFDISAAFRLAEPAAYESFYGFAHEYPALLEQAVYGLAERNAAQIAQANLIAVPGCYPTSVLLPLSPLVDAGAIDRSQSVIADCTSGVSGAGRSPSLKNMFCEVTYQPYGVLSHRHTPEINQHSGAEVIFTPHLAPFDRGIVSTIHATLADGWNEASVRACLNEAYRDASFVRLLPSGTWPTVAGVRGTNFCDIAMAVQPASRHLILFSAIDNLLKGAAGQAVQCLNLRFGYPEHAALSVAAGATRKELAHAHA